MRLKPADKVARYRTEGTLTAYVVRRLGSQCPTSSFVASEWSAVAPFLTVDEVRAVLASPEYKALIERVRQQQAHEVQRLGGLALRAAHEAADQAECQRQEAARKAEKRRAAARRRSELAKVTDPDCPYQTLKEARADGWHDARPEEYGGERLLLRGHQLIRSGKAAKSRTAWSKLGYRVKSGAQSHATVRGRRSSWEVFREDQVEHVNQDLIDRLDEAAACGLLPCE